VENTRPFEGVVLSFARDLQAQGHRNLAASILEVVPETGAVRDGEGRVMTAERLRRVAAIDGVDPRLRQKAADLAEVAASDVKVRGRTGTVWVAWQEFDDDASDPDDHVGADGGWYWVSWQSDRGDDHWYEDGPSVSDLRVVLRWSRERTDAIVVRPRWASGTEYWAGQGEPRRNLPPLDESHT
jgi:hypothetical protein